MGHIPLSTLVIAAAMLIFSVLIVSRMGGRIPLSARSKGLLLCAGILFFAAGLFLHWNETPPKQEHQPKPSVADRRSPQSTFTFKPSQARWGDEVEIELPVSAEDVTVYLNGMPLPKKVRESGTRIAIRIPSGAKTGWLELERNGVMTRAESPITIVP